MLVQRQLGNLVHARSLQSVVASWYHPSVQGGDDGEAALLAYPASAQQTHSWQQLDRRREGQQPRSIEVCLLVPDAPPTRSIPRRLRCPILACPVQNLPPWCHLPCDLVMHIQSSASAQHADTHLACLPA